MHKNIMDNLYNEMSDESDDDEEDKAEVEIFYEAKKLEEAKKRS